ncbi:MAG: reverse transcriptase domain-containing protein [Aquiluna sp.]
MKIGIPRYFRVDRDPIFLKSTEGTPTLFEDFAATMKIGIKASAPNVHAQNGRAERMNRVIYESATAMLENARLPLGFWASAVVHAARLHNVTSSRRLQGQTPWQNHFGKPPDVGHLRVWGSPSFVTQVKPARGSSPAFKPRALFAVYLGPTEDSAPGTNRFYVIETRRVVISRSAYIDEAGAFVVWSKATGNITLKFAPRAIQDADRAHLAKLRTKQHQTFPRLDDQETGRPDSHVPMELDVATMLPDNIDTVPLDDTAYDMDSNTDNTTLLRDSSPEALLPTQSCSPPRWSLELFDAGPSISPGGANTTRASAPTGAEHNQASAPGGVTQQPQSARDANTVTAPVQPDASLPSDTESSTEDPLPFPNSVEPDSSYTSENTENRGVESAAPRRSARLAALRRDTYPTAVACCATPSLSLPASGTYDHAPVQVSALEQFLFESAHLDDSVTHVSKSPFAWDEHFAANEPTIEDKLKHLNTAISDAAAYLQTLEAAPADPFLAATAGSSDSITDDDGNQWPGYDKLWKKPPSPKSISELHPPYSGRFTVEFDKLPRSVRKFAEKHGKEGFIAAIESELNGFVDAEVFCEPNSPTTSTRAMPSHILLVLKADRKKARLVANGKFQRAHMDYSKTDLFSPVVDRTVTRVIYSIAAATKAHLHSFDVKQAFLNGQIFEPLYIRLPPGIKHDGPPGAVFQLRKSLYGIRQAPRLWASVLEASLKRLGLTQSKTDPCVWHMHRDGDLFILGVHVDDGLLCSTSLTLLEEFKAKLKTIFQIVDLGPLDGKRHLGTEVIHNREAQTVHLSCDSKIKDMLASHGLQNIEGTTEPALPSAGDAPSTPAEQQHFNIRSLLGSCAYLADTVRPDIATASSILASASTMTT